jgi:hypothetical protein
MSAQLDERPHGELGPHGAFWCLTHTRWECTRNSKRTKERCHDLAIRGRDACKTHIGESTELAKAKGEANILAAAWSGMGEVEQLQPAETALRLLTMSWMRVHVYAERLRLMFEEHPDEALVGVTYAAGRDGARVETGEQIRGMAKLEGDERDRCARLTKMCHDMGIAERHIELQQAQAAIVVGAMRGAMDVAGSELLPGTRDAMLRAFLSGLNQVPELEGPPDPPPPGRAAAGRDGE